MARSITYEHDKEMKYAVKLLMKHYSYISVSLCACDCESRVRFVLQDLLEPITYIYSLSTPTLGLADRKTIHRFRDYLLGHVCEPMKYLELSVEWEARAIEQGQMNDDPEIRRSESRHRTIACIVHWRRSQSFPSTSR